MIPAATPTLIPPIWPADRPESADSGVGMEVEGGRGDLSSEIEVASDGHEVMIDVEPLVVVGMAMEAVLTQH
jgi:hypothetical protein